MKLCKTSHIDFFGGCIIMNVAFLIKNSDSSSYLLVRDLLGIKLLSNLSQSDSTLISLESVFELSDSSEYH